MTHSPRDTYLESQVRTATPQRLRLMLIDGALRFARQALALWDDPQQRVVCREALGRCRDIVHELYATIRADECPAGKTVKAVYLFLYQQLAAASLHHHGQKVQDAIRVLEEERETWRQVCQQMPEAPARAGGAACREVTARDLPPLVGLLQAPAQASQLSLEA
ncbi:MAG: flagellar protein FliS [Pirellulaceae bacterium]|jgi:flagellar protein FliS|nr:flagellar protein FliS [Pirellulaceae bacterium]